MTSLCARLLGGLLLTAGAVVSLNAESPKRVLMLHSFGPEFGDLYAKDLRVQLGQRLPGDLQLYEQWLVSARFRDGSEDEAFASYLRALFADHPLDLIITLGAPAADFLQRHQQSLFQNTPVLLTDVEERRAAGSAMPNATSVAISVGFPALVEHILRIQPQTRTIAVVIGNSPIEKFWVEQIRHTLDPFADRIALTFLTDLSFSDVLKRVASLPRGSAIFYVMLSPEVAGIPQDEDTAIAALHAAANAPIYSYTDAYLGKGIVGGPLISGETQGREAASVAARLLAGESAAKIRTPPITFGNPRYDWRELKRWNIRESELPPGSEVVFREPSAWERYRWQMLTIGGILALQTALIFTLLRERERRRTAEMDAHQRISELARMNRRSAVGELSAAIAHELAQPLGAILRNTEAADLLLEAPSVNLGEIREIMADIGRDQRRASEVIRRLRSLLAKSPAETREVDLNEIVHEVVELLSAQAAALRVALGTNLVPGPLWISGDAIQLEQVMLNLVMNALESIKSNAGSERKITACTKILDGGAAEITVEDSGHGIPSGKVQQIFEPFFTTKESGIGMGLSIARTIVERHQGRIWAENRREGGAVVRFTLPLAETHAYGTAVSSPDDGAGRTAP
jgi:signal transduction histidine kinase